MFSCALIVVALASVFFLCLYVRERKMRMSKSGPSSIHRELSLHEPLLLRFGRYVVINIVVSVQKFI